MSAPVRYTCPDIDKAIKLINDGLKEMYSVLSLDDIDEIKESIRYAYSIIEDTPAMLEDLRSDNSDLRDWGHGLEKKVDDLENQIIELTQ